LAILEIISFCFTFVLALITMRRVILTLAAVFVKSSLPQKSEKEPFVIALVPARNEEDVVARCLDGLLRIDWPREKILIVAIDDGSTDGTAAIIESYAHAHENIELLTRAGPNAGIGKGAALNDALERYDIGDFVFLLDADSVAAPDALRILYCAMDAQRADAAQGGMLPEESAKGLGAFYTGLESLVHQGITMTGADRIGATVSLLGSNTLISRKALGELGGFHPSSRLEDIDMTMAMANAGMKIVFEPRAESIIIPSHSAKEAVTQHRAWSREYFRIAVSRFLETTFASAGVVQRADRLIFAFGYLDRLFVIGYVVLALVSSATKADFAPWWFLAVVLVVPGIQCLLAMHRARKPLSDYGRLFVMPFAYMVDLAVHCMAFSDALCGKGRDWQRSRGKAEGV
jgi:cellulose synthase/poly-beta-1,6-N-acetylglucosamine synthase-like glycosyltransferase